MNKKQKKKLCLWIAFAVIVIGCIVALVISGNRKPEVVQFEMNNSDIMEFNPFISNEERLDNGLLEYGKVLSKYSSKQYKDYAGEDIVVNPSSYTAFSFVHDNGETVTLNVKAGAVENVTYKGKTYTYDKLEEKLTADADADFAKAFIAQCKEYASSLKFDEDYSYTYYEDVADYNKTSADPKDRYAEKSGVIKADPNAVISTTEEYSYTYTIENIPEDGLYSLSLDYFVKKNRDNSAVLEFKVNGKYPFKEAGALELKRTYGFYDVGSIDVGGSEIMAQQQELFGWNSFVLQHPNGIYRNPYKFYLKAGTNEITLTFSREPVVVNKIAVIAPMDNMSYEEYKVANGFSEDKIYTGDSIRVQLEVPSYKTNPSLRMLYDKNAASDPPAYKNISYNIFGGDRWSSGGEGATWMMTVPEDGWYQLGIRSQNTLTDIAVYREVKIDGVIPFAEVEEYCFPYVDGWIGSAFIDSEQNPYLFYLTKGEHEITLTSKVGPLRASVQRLTEIMDDVSKLVSDVAKITGAERNDSGGYTVDKNRDWDLQLYITDIQEKMDYYVDSFNDMYDMMKESNGGALPYYGSSISVARNLFERMAEDLEDIPASLNDINETLSSLSTTLSEITVMPIEVDYLVISGTDEDYADARSNSWQDFKVACIQFVQSFSADYSTMGTRTELEGESKGEIEVYVARGREYVDILRNQIAETFTPNTGIKVDVNMVFGGVEGLIMLRYVAGTAPDVALSVNAAAPVEYACRGALVPLNDLNKDGVDDGNTYGFVDLMHQYPQGSFNYSAYRDYYYSFPETQIWNAMFYRTDILEELEIDVPETWDDIYEILPILQEHNYEFCFNYGIGNYYPFLYQAGGTVYAKDGMTSALDSDIAFDAFMEYCDIYNKYNVPYAANFYMNFKMGGTPIGIADTNFYCQLKYSAPEIADKWKMAPLPGHVREDGTIDRSIGGTLTSCVIIDNNDEQRTMNSWEFLKWWLGVETQTEYANEVEATFGVGSRWQTANKEAINNMPYTDEEIEIIQTVWADFEETPVVPGGYYTNRYLLTALNQAILQGMNPRVALEDAVREINKEMKRKQNDFGLTDYVLNYELIDGTYYNKYKESN
ncbi:MAG: extracellular solute-binding protein [Ruminococcaceae bacterium]|nr:extracellular solute-binding protein [Oscillospiraceae bacterium]